jgi:hypothetical protein
MEERKRSGRLPGKRLTVATVTQLALCLVCSGAFAGDDDRASVNQTLIEPFLNYNLGKGWYLISDIIIIANWQADSSNRWTVPLGGGVGKLLKIGNQAINVRTEAYYNVEKPDSAPDWQWGFTIQFLFPK